jgi:hypothetical protein
VALEAFFDSNLKFWLSIFGANTALSDKLINQRLGARGVVIQSQLTMASGCSQRQILLTGSTLLLSSYLTNFSVHGWRNKEQCWRMRHSIIRGGSTSSIDETVIMESFAEEVTKLRQEIKQETDAMIEKLREEIMDAKNRGAIQQQKKKQQKVEEEEEDYATAAESEDIVEDAHVFEEDDHPTSKVNTLDIEEEVDEELDDEDLVAPQRVIEEPKDDFLVGDSDEEPDSVLHRMKDAGGKMEDLVDEIQQDDIEQAVVSEDNLGSSLESGMKVSSSLNKPKQKEVKSKKHKKPKDKLTRPEGVKKKSEKKKTKKKTKKKKSKSKKLSEEKEAIRTALSSKLQGSHQLQLLKSSNIQLVAKGFVLAVLVALTLLVLRVLENSVSAAVPKK